MALFNVHDSDNSIKQLSEPEAIQINPHSIMDKECAIEVYMHPSGDSMAVSPNNAAFLMDCISPISSFYSVCIIPYQDGTAKMMISLYFFIRI